MGEELPGQDGTLQREVELLRARVAELQRQAARHEETADVSLAEREELLREAERVAHLGTWTYDLGSGRVTWSEEMYRILGRDPSLLAPSVEAFFEAVHPDDRAGAQAVTAQAMSQGILPLFDCRVVRPDGSIRETTHTSSMLFDANGTLRRMVGGVLDRTDSLAVEARLRGVRWRCWRKRSASRSWAAGAGIRALVSWSGRSSSGASPGCPTTARRKRSSSWRVW